MKNKLKVVILGAGPSGLSCAWELAEKGYSVVVVEKENRCGGLCVTNEYKGFRFDLGGHRFISSDMELIRKVQSLLNERLLVSERRSIIKMQNKEFAYPIKISDFLTKLNIGCLVRIFGDLICKISNRKLNRQIDSLEDWCVEEFGRTIYNTFFKDYNEKLWGISAKYIACDWAAQRIPSLNARSFIMDILRISNEKKRTFSKYYFYPKGGIGEIFESITNEIEKKNAQIFTGANLLEIITENNKAKKIIFTHNKETVVVDCDYLVSTIPLNSFVALCRDNDKFHELNAWASCLRFRSLRFMNLLIDKPVISSNTWQYIPDKNVIFTRIQEPKSRSRYMAPENKTSLMLEIPCNKGDSVWHSQDADLLQRITEGLKNTGVNLKENEVLGYFSTFAEHAYPIYAKGYFKNRKRIIESLIGSFSNVILCGRQGAFSYLFMDFAMAAGIKSAKFINGDDKISRLGIANISNNSQYIEANSLSDAICESRKY